jgi:hypothetical protein
MKFILTYGLFLYLCLHVSAQLESRVYEDTDVLEVLNLDNWSNLNTPKKEIFSSYRIDNDYIILEWAFKAHESIEFRVERLLPAEGIYETVGLIKHKIKPDATSNYQFLDENSYYESSFYRLVALRSNGTEQTMHQYRMPGASKQYDVAAEVDVFPNPTQGQLFIDLQKISPVRKGVTVSLLSNSGQLLHQYLVATDVLIHYPSSVIKPLLPALYTLRFDFEDGRQLFKQFVKH